MEDTRQYKYVHKLGSAVILESPHEVVICFYLLPQFMIDQKTKTVLSRYQMFRAQVGVGKTHGEAEESLKRVFKSYVESYGLENGLPSFLAKLRKHGFRPQPRKTTWISLPLNKSLEVRLPIAA